jgi:hypothetical protein
MASGGLHRVLRDVRSWLGSLVGAGDGYAALVRREQLRKLGIATAVFGAFILAGVGGCALGSAQVGDAADARQAGVAAGEKRGAAVGEREGYRSAFRSAREDAYDAAYREAYTAAYRDAFEEADLDLPSTVEVVEVSGP